MAKPRMDWKQNDTGYTNVVTLLDRDRNAINGTGATVTFHMRTGGTTKIDAAAEWDAAASGTVKYNRTAANTDTPGIYQAEFEVTFSDTTIQTYPEDGFITVEIHDDIS